MGNGLIIGLFVLGLCLMSVVLVHMIVKNSFCSPQKESEKMAIDMMKKRLNNPSDFKVISISQMDSIFQNRFCPEYETQQLTEDYYNLSNSSISTLINSLSDKEHAEDKGLLADMYKYSGAMENVNFFNELLEKPQGDFCGWRMKMKYSYTDENNILQNTESWLIFDVDRRFIFKTFEFPVL